MFIIYCLYLKKKTRIAENTIQLVGITNHIKKKNPNLVKIKIKPTSTLMSTETTSRYGPVLG